MRFTVFGLVNRWKFDMQTAVTDTLNLMIYNFNDIPNAFSFSHCYCALLPPSPSPSPNVHPKQAVYSKSSFWKRMPWAKNRIQSYSSQSKISVFILSFTLAITRILILILIHLLRFLSILVFIGVLFCSFIEKRMKTFLILCNYLSL